MANKRVVFAAASTIALLTGLLNPPPARAAKPLAGHGAIGGSMGWMGFLSGDRLSRSNPRPIFHLHTGYYLTESIGLEGEIGFGWNSYPVAEDGLEQITIPGDGGSVDTITVVAPTVAVVSPWTLGAHYRWHPGDGNLYPHLGAGVGGYILDVREDYKTTAKDPVTGEKMQWMSPGFYLKAGGEIVWDTGGALSIDLLYHSIFSENDDFVNGWATNTSFLELRIGGTYYFNLGGGSGAVPEAEQE